MLAIGQVIGAGVNEGTRTINGQASYAIPIVSLLASSLSDTLLKTCVARA